MNKTAERPLVVYKASAGSGKTFTLATEYIKLLVRNPHAFRHTLAVTFTNKATEEMKMRILSQLYGIWKGLPQSDGYARRVEEDLQVGHEQVRRQAGIALMQLLHNYSYFRVETIDSFFQTVLRNLARELDLTANLRVGLNDSQVEEMAVDQLIDGLQKTDQVLQWLLKYVMENISDDRSWNVVGQVKSFGQTIFRDYYKEQSGALYAAIRQKGFLDNYAARLREMKKEAQEHMAELANAFFTRLKSVGLDIDDFAYGNSGVAGIFQKIRDGVFDESIVTKRVTDCLGEPEKWCKKNHERRDLICHLAATEFGDLLQQVLDERPRQWRLYKSADLTLRHLSQLRLLDSIEKKVRELNDEAGRFLLSDTQQLLHELIDGSDSPFIFEKIGTRLEHIMIDEFQDTSTVQWQNFKVLLNESMSHESGSNLIVGDVKQSIYRWRSGDWRLLAGIKGQFANGDAMVEIRTLDTNYRSEQGVVDFNNAFFTLAAQAEGVTAYDDVVQKTPDGKGQSGYVEVRLLPNDDYQQQMLDCLATQVEALLQQGTRPADMAILVRTNSQIPLIANYLMERLPLLRVVSDEAFRLDASTAVQTIVQALRCLVNPNDTISRAFLSLAFSGRIDGDLPPCFTPDLLQLPLYELTEQLYALFHLEQADGQTAYLCAFYDQVAKYVTDNVADAAEFLREWDESIGAKTIQSPEVDGLRLISIHKSKGLEFPIVLVPFCDWRLEHVGNILWCKPQEAPFDQLPIVPVDYSQKGMAGTIYSDDYDEEHQQNVVDNLNLLYVAFTRAASQLYVYGKRKAMASRSGLIERVLPQVAALLPGSVITGTDDEKTAMVMRLAPSVPPASPVEAPRQKGESEHEEANPFLAPAVPTDIKIEVFSQKVEFRQSTKSRQFVEDNSKEENQTAPGGQETQPVSYIQIGSVLHNVFSTIRSTADIDSALTQLEQEGIIYGSDLSRRRLLDMIRKRLASPRVAEWFEPDRWTLFNECTILGYNAQTGNAYERRPDRVMTDGQQTIVVDFKFGTERAEYHDQVREYMHLLTQMGMPSVKGFLWFVYSNKVVEVNL